MSSDAQTQRIPSADTERTREYVWPSADPGPDARTMVIDDTPAAPAVAPLGTVEPEPTPRRRGNRAGGLLIALLATVVFAALDLAALVGLEMLRSGTAVSEAALALFPLVIGPSVGFALALALIVLIVNRAGWWAYVLGGFLVAVVAAGAGLAALWLAAHGTAVPSVEQLRRILTDARQWPSLVTAAIIAREVTVWAGAWIGARGRRRR